MDNLRSYLPHQEAAAALTDFYTSLETVASYPATPPSHWLVHRVGRLGIIFHCSGIVLEWDLVKRFAAGMLDFTRRGYTSSYHMQFTHLTYGFIISISFAILDPDPEPEGNCVNEEHGQVNESGIHQHTSPVEGSSLRPEMNQTLHYELQFNEIAEMF
ncbi:MAG: hypothetical protein Q9182_000885 [Xanthomendoza sp. 2 TL-2023]